MTTQIPNWMKRFLHQDELEEKEELETPVKLLDTNGRCFIRWMCNQYAVTANGVMGQACSLLECYLARKMKTYSHLPPRSIQWIRIKKNMTMRVPLLASVCIALTTKMMSSEGQVHSKSIRRLLARVDFERTLEQINSAEMDVLSTLNFHIPMFTNVEKALMMAFDVGMTGVLLEAVGLVMEVTEHYRYIIQDTIISVASTINGNNNIRRRDIGNVWHVHLVAGAVAATGRFFLFSGDDVMPRLCFLTKSSQVYIRCISNVVYTCLVTECRANELASRKRKHE